MPALFCPLEPAWGDIGTWFAGIASFAAVLAALYLAKRADKPKAKGRLYTAFITPDVDTELTAFNVANIGTHSITIHNCFIEFRGLARRLTEWPAAVCKDWRHVANSRLPANIQRGETFFYATDGTPFAEFLAKSPLPAWLVVRTIRAGVSTPWGPICVKIDPDTRKKLQQQIVAYRAEHPKQKPAAG